MSSSAEASTKTEPLYHTIDIAWVRDFTIQPHNNFIILSSCVKKRRKFFRNCCTSESADIAHVAVRVSPLLLTYALSVAKPSTNSLPNR